MALLDKINYLTLPNKISVQTSSQSAAGVQNWKDGSSSGSVRTSGSSVQDAEYKIGQYAVTEGSNTKAQGRAAHAEGNQSTANGSYSHAEGFYTQASGTSSHAEGLQTKALGSYSHVEGIRTKSTHAYQHVFGAYNKLDSSSNLSDEKGTYIEIVGNGTSDNLTNARTLDWQGNETLSGKLTAKEISIKTENEDGPSIEANGGFMSFAIPQVNVSPGGSAKVYSDHSSSSTLLGTLSYGFYRYYETADVNGTTWYQIIYNYTTPGWVAESSYVSANRGYNDIDYVSIDVWNEAAKWIHNNKTAALTDTNDMVSQNNSVAAIDYRVLLSYDASDYDKTAGAYKSAGLRFMPSTNHLYVGNAGQEALITVSPRMHLGAFNRYDQDGSTSSETSYGLGMGINNGLAYNSYFTISMLSFQHWNSSRPSGGTPSSTNYVQTEAYLNSNNLAVKRYSGKDTLSTSATLSDTLLTFVTTAGNSYTVGPTKISHWDQVYNWFQPIQEIYQDNGITMEGTKGKRYFTYSSHNIPSSQLCNRVNPVSPEGLTITAYQNGGVVSFNITFQVTTAVTNATALFEFTPRYQPANALQCVIVKYANKRYTRPEALGAYVSTNNTIMANNLQANTSYRISGTYMLK